MKGQVNMSETAVVILRHTGIHLLRSGCSPEQVVQEVGRSLAWVYKWQARFRAEGWSGLSSRSRAHHRHRKQLAAEVCQAIRRTRSELEAKAAQPDQLHYVGAGAVRARLADWEVKSLPSRRSIERVLKAAGMTRLKLTVKQPVHYPHLDPQQPHQLIQVDIVPHYLTGGQAVACFNAIDVVSRNPTGWPSLKKRSDDAAQFLILVWQELGISDYTQIDNESCFSGGMTHPGVLGKVLRLGLYIGTELVFSPVGNPESNGTVERFHQDYNEHVWAHTDLQSKEDVGQAAERFFQLYRCSRHHSALNGHSPAELHHAQPFFKLPADFTLPSSRLPLTAGRVHFMRLVNPARQVSVLNQFWEVPEAKPGQGVWVTIEFSCQGARLLVFDTAPDVQVRTCLAEHPFPLKEPVQPLRVEFQRYVEPEKSWINLAMEALVGKAQDW